MGDKRLSKIQRLLALANDANDEESLTALAKAQELMLENKISEDDIFQYKQQEIQQNVVNAIIYKGRPHKWVYRLAGIIAVNFRVKFYYDTTYEATMLHFVGLESDVKIAEVTFMYAKGSVAYCSREFMKRKEIKRKYKKNGS